MTRVLLVIAILFGLLTLVGSVYYAFGMDSDSESLYRIAQASCFTIEGAESVERCAPITRATVDGEMLTFVSQIGIASWLAVICLAFVSLWLLVRATRPGPLVPRWAAWVIAACSGWLLLSPLDKIWDEEYAEGLSTPATGVLSQYFPAVIGESSARVWLGSTDAAYAAVGRLFGQVFVLLAVALLVVAVMWLLQARRPPIPSAR